MVEASIRKIGIIGGGIGGTSTAYFIRELFKDKIDIDLYEAGTIGGRLATSKKFDHEYETGGSIIHPRNLYMQQFVEQLGLKKRGVCASHLGIFNGKDYAFVESDWQVVNIFKLFHRYGLDIYHLQNLNKDILDKFSRIYNLQKNGQSFKTVSTLLAAMHPEFPKYLTKSFRDFLKEKGFQNLIIDELLTSITRTNYGQSINIHTFVGSVSVAGASNSLWSVLGGNKRVAEELLKASNANLFPKTVTSIIYTKDHKFQIVSSRGGHPFLHHDSKETYNYSPATGAEIYDAVVIAAPMTRDKSIIRLQNGSLSFKGSYQRIVCTLVQGSLNSTTFLSEKFGSDIDEILSYNPDLFYNSVGRQRSINIMTSSDCQSETTEVYKIFSPMPLTQDQLEILFDSWTKIENVDWLAYPHYIMDEKLEDFELMPGLYYNNVIEKVASAMEMSVIAAKNSALLIHKFLEPKTTKWVNTKSEL